MNSKEKAKEIIGKMFDRQWRQGAFHCSDKEFRNACHCAIIMVDEILKLCVKDISDVKYWASVKIEIESFLNGKSNWSKK